MAQDKFHKGAFCFIVIHIILFEKLVVVLNHGCCLSKTSYPFESPETNGKTVNNPPVHQLVRSGIGDLLPKHCTKREQYPLFVQCFVCLHLFTPNHLVDYSYVRLDDLTGQRDRFRWPATNVNILEISHVQYCLYLFRSQTPAASSRHEEWRDKR